MLLNRGQRTVRVINGNATAYDWNLGGGGCEKFLYLLWCRSLEEIVFEDAK